MEDLSIYGHDTKSRPTLYEGVSAYVEELIEPGHFVRSAMVFKPLDEETFFVTMRARYYDFNAGPYKTFDAAVKAAERFAGGERGHRTWTANKSLEGGG